MFLKISGAVAIIFASYICGLYMANRSTFRNQDLEQMKKALTIFKGEILYSANSLENIFFEISNRTIGIISLLFETVAKNIEKHSKYGISEIWDTSILEITNNSYFDSEDMEYIYSFGRTLGFADKNQQVNNAMLLIEYIDSAQKGLREKKVSEEKLYKTLGLTCGLMLVIVLF